MKAVPERVKKNIVSLLKCGHSTRKISVNEGVSKSTVSRIRKRHARETRRHHQNGSPPALGLRQERNIVRKVLSGEWSNAVKAKNSLKFDYGIDLSAVTIRRALKRNGLFSYIKRKKLYLRKIY